MVLIILMNSKVNIFSISQVQKHVDMREKRKMVSLVWEAHFTDIDSNRKS